MQECTFLSLTTLKDSKYRSCRQPVLQPIEFRSRKGERPFARVRSEADEPAL